MDDFYTSFGKTIREKRRAQKMSVSEIADIMDCSGSHYNRVENGKVDLRISDFKKLCEIFDVDYSLNFEAVVTIKKEINLNGKTGKNNG